MTIVLIAVASGLGAALRLVVDRGLAHTRLWGQPIATVVINVSGSWCAGIVTGVAVGGMPQLVTPAAALLGSYTTFSTAMVEVLLASERPRPIAAAHALLPMGLALAAALFGVAIGHRIV